MQTDKGEEVEGIPCDVSGVKAARSSRKKKQAKLGDHSYVRPAGANGHEREAPEVPEETSSTLLSVVSVREETEVSPILETKEQVDEMVEVVEICQPEDILQVQQVEVRVDLVGSNLVSRGESMLQSVVQQDEMVNPSLGLVEVVCDQRDGVVEAWGTQEGVG